MAKMINCKTCGAEIAKSARVCPNCGARVKRHTVLGVVLVVFGMLIIIGAIAGGNGSEEPARVENSQPPTETVFSKDESTKSTVATEATEATEKPEKNTFGVGETVELNRVRATLLSVTSNYGANYITPTAGNVYVVCEFEIENGTDGDIAVSSMISFDAYFDDYAANLSLGAMTSGGATQLDGTIAAGKKMKGVVGYEAPEDWKEVEIHYSPSFWGKEIIFTAAHE